MLALSVVCDAMLHSAARVWFPRSPHTPSAIVASYSLTFPALVFMGRTFSNTLETVFVAAAIWIASCATLLSRYFPTDSQGFSRLCFLFGALVGVGAFVRLSFLFWAWPVGFYLIVSHAQLQSGSVTADSFLSSALRVSTLVAVPCALVCTLLCVADSLYFEALWICVRGDDNTRGEEDGSTSCVSGIRAVGGAMVHSILAGRWPQFRVSGEHEHQHAHVLLVPLR